MQIANRKREKGKFITTHGLHHTRLYKIWGCMKTRCNNPNNINYKNYGGRGIKICDEWNISFESFYIWSLNNGYKDDLSIDRIDNNRGYSPDNCRWATKKQQSRNKRVSHMITFNGKTQCLADWLDELGIKRVTFKARVSRGMTDQEALQIGDLRHSLKGRHRDGLRGKYV